MLSDKHVVRGARDLAVIGCLGMVLAGCGGAADPRAARTPSPTPSSRGPAHTPAELASGTPTGVPSAGVPSAGAGGSANLPGPGDLSGDWSETVGGAGQFSDGTGNGQYMALMAGTVSFTDSGGTITETARSSLSCYGVAQTLPQDTVLATFYRTGDGSYRGRVAMWDVTHTSCKFGFWTPVTVAPGDGGLDFSDGGPSLTMMSTDALPVPVRMIFHRYVGAPPSP